MCNYSLPRLAVAALALMMVTAAGCSPTLYKVEGRLLWDDGKPVGGASVRFIPVTGTTEAIGFTDKDGAFTLSSGGAGQGALAGDYKVVVTKSPASPEFKGGEAVTPDELRKAGKAQFRPGTLPPSIVDPVPGVYGTPEKTPLTWKVDATNLKPELKIKRS